MPNGIDGLLIDIDGVLVNGAGPLPGALEALVRLRAASVPFRLLTNLSRLSPAEISRRLEACGFSVDPEEIWNPPRLALERLARRPDIARSPMLVAVASECLDGYQPDPPVGPDEAAGGVLIGDPGMTPSPAELARVRRAIAAGAGVWLMSRQPDPPILGLEPRDGFDSLLDLAAAARGKVELLGKPDPGAFLRALEDLGLPGDAVVAMVGDDPEVDMAGAAAAGLTTVHLLSGRSSVADRAAADPAPDHCADDFGAFVHRWLRIR